MGSEPDARTAALFREALARSAAERAAFLRSAAEGEDGLRREVEALIAAHESAGDFLAPPARPSAAPPPPFAGDRYRVVREIGRGGMATVWLAEQRDPVERTVALKVMEYRLHGAEAQRRFAVERQAVARMDHPLIAQIFDAGTTLDGRPYLAMEYVPGVAITTFSRERGLSLAGRLRLAVSVCHAVHHAHTKGVVHRDLKPSNLLVVEQDGRPVPKLIDFGIAKASSPAGDRATVTAQGELLGTLEYMSPEQAQGGAAGVDARTDVYSLGGIVYELVTGRLPLAIGEARARGFAHALAVIERDDPPAPSAALAAAARAERDPARRRELLAQTRLARGDLDGIVMKALEKSAHRRYATARDLADDLDRFLAHEPVVAVPPGRLDRFRKLVARHRAASAGVVGVILSLVAGLAVAISMVREVNRQTAKLADSESRVRAQLFSAQSFAVRLTEFADAELANIPGSVDARVKLAEWAVDEQERIAAAAERPETHAPNLGYAWQRRGEAYAAAGRSRDAITSFERSLKARAIAARGAPSVDNRRAYCVGHWRVSDGARLVGDFERALDLDRKALAIMETLQGEHAFSVRDCAVYVGISHRRIAEDLAERGDTAAARSEFERAVAEVEAGAAIDADYAPLRDCWILALSGLAAARRATGDEAAALALLERALALLDRHATQLGANHAWTRLQIARCAAARADVLLALRRTDDAAAAATRAVAVADALCDDDPSRFEAREVAAVARVARGRVLFARREEPAAREDVANAVARLHELARDDPDRASVARELASAEETDARWAPPTAKGE
jgi:serine/threonine protein kinase